MSDHATKDNLKQLEGRIDAKIDKAVSDLSEIIASFAQRADDRLNKLELRIDSLDKKFDRLLNTFDAFIKRLAR